MWLIRAVLEMVRDDFLHLIKRRDLESFLRMLLYFSFFLFLFFLFYSRETPEILPPVTPII
ncbi:MAG: hypothetical protein HS115_04380 [Spirochaetales bacterium]|nr:hypothetical protein [Spirochaetales bacterium]